MKTAIRNLLFLVIVGTSSFGATFNVNPTGNCAIDLPAVQSAVNSAASGDTVQLGAGDFNFACDGGGVFVGTPNLAIAGVPGQTSLHGLGPSDPAESTGIFIGAAGVSVSGVSMNGFFQAIFAGRKAANFSATGSSFAGNSNAIFVGGGAGGARIVNNAINVPAPTSGDIRSDFGATSGILVARQNSFVLIAGNTITGPGVSVHFTGIDQLNASASGADLGLRSLGLFQVDTVLPVSNYGRISNNTISGFDLALQSSSDSGIVSNNVVRNSAIGIAISNDVDDGQTQVTDSAVTQNISTENQVGILLASASRNVISLNDVARNTLGGLVFINNFGGAPSTGNFYVLNLGRVVNAKGNFCVGPACGFRRDDH